MPSSPQPIGTLRRPPIVRTGSSSSSLSGMEQTVPSFQSFIKRTPPLNQQKPLPPTPLIPRRASSTSPLRSRSRTPSIYAGRRSSSVYSRTVSQWENASWRSADFADEPLPPLPTLQPLAYSASTPQLGVRQQTPPPLQPRAYSPIIHSPSPTASTATTPSLLAEHGPSILLPTPPVFVQLPKKHLRTVSLDKAKAAVNAPGALHLLPEELRAQRSGRSPTQVKAVANTNDGVHLLAKSSGYQSIRKSKSHEPLRIDSFALIAGITPLDNPLVLKDHQNRHRTIQSPAEVLAAAAEYPFPAVSPGPINITAPVKAHMSPKTITPPLESQQRKASRDKVIQALGIGESDEPRGRTRHRASRNPKYSHYIPKSKRTSDSCSSQETDAQKIGREYHSLLAEQYRRPTNAPDLQGTDSDDGIKSRMKMVPKPLFQVEPPGRGLGSVRSQRAELSISPHNLQSDSDGIGTPRRRLSRSSRDLFPSVLRLGSPHRRTSTSGSIPISPPFELSSTAAERLPGKPFSKRRKAPKAHTHCENVRTSAYYPHIASRKGSMRGIRPREAGSRTPPKPLLSADIIAQRQQTPESTSDSSPRRNTPFSSVCRNGSLRRESNASSDGMRQPLYRRAAHGAAKYADLLTKPAELPERRHYQPVTAAAIAPSSPHLPPSPVKSNQQLHLGWSDRAKVSFDESRSPVQSPRLFTHPKMPKAPQFTHIAAPARPLDESKAGLTEVESPRRKGSIFGGWVEGWKESKAERRRGELKKSIRMVPQSSANAAMMNRRSSTFAWMQ